MPLIQVDILLHSICTNQKLSWFINVYCILLSGRSDIYSIIPTTKISYKRMPHCNPHFFQSNKGAYDNVANLVHQNAYDTRNIVEANFHRLVISILNCIILQLIFKMEVFLDILSIQFCRWVQSFHENLCNNCQLNPRIAIEAEVYDRERDIDASTKQFHRHSFKMRMPMGHGHCQNHQLRYSFNQEDCTSHVEFFFFIALDSKNILFLSIR